MTILDTIQSYRDQLDRLLAGQPQPRTLADRPLADQLARFEEIAQGKLERGQATPAFVAEVEEAVDRLLVLLCVPPDMQKRAIDVVPREVWTRSQLGILLAEVAWWVYQDDLITLSEAAQVLYGDVSKSAFYRLGQLVDGGSLIPYINPHEANPQYASRVRRSEAVKVKEQQDRSHEQERAAPAPLEPMPDIIAMHDDEGLSFGEIGRRLGKHRQQIHTMYHRLKGKQQSSS